jgi:3-dehydroquinate dehydratase
LIAVFTKVSNAEAIKVDCQIDWVIFSYHNESDLVTRPAQALERAAYLPFNGI